MTSKLSTVEDATNTARNLKNGRFASVQRCDFCGKPITGAHLTDERVCGGTDGPGFYLCARVRCVEKRQAVEDASGIDGLRVVYRRKG